MLFRRLGKERKISVRVLKYTRSCEQIQDVRKKRKRTGIYTYGQYAKSSKNLHNNILGTIFLRTYTSILEKAF